MATKRKRPRPKPAQDNERLEKERIDLLLKLAEFQGKRLDERRNHSWKISFAFWASILGSLALIETVGKGLTIQSVEVLGAGALLLHAVWLVMVFEADKRDKVTAFVARDEAMTLLGLEPPTRDIETRKFYADWSVQFQFATTFFLLVVVILIFGK